ncbi:MAG: hypothetical protein RMY36_026895 [Nostoc sp. SerVER01]|nr:hypothetical protein [Nostoc sp. SerVER01]MDZ8081268.1 hypothetical protein [Nostoc sp. DcaGUA01]
MSERTGLTNSGIAYNYLTYERSPFRHFTTAIAFLPFPQMPSPVQLRSLTTIPAMSDCTSNSFLNCDGTKCPPSAALCCRFSAAMP